MKKKIIIASMLIALLGLTSCSDDATKVSMNLSKAADNFEIDRRIIFYNGITGEYMLSIEGKCSITDEVTQLEVTCQTGENEFKKHFLGLSDNVTYFAEQIEGEFASKFHSRITFKPQEIFPDIDFRGSTKDTPNIDNKDN